MNWGTALLFVDGLMEGLASVIDTLLNLIPMMIYSLWKGIGFLVDLIENLFRSLAGADGNDPAAILIQNETVNTIFNNLIAVSTALLVFFTIFKIIQEQYKEKEGGNPYIIVFRMFKGMLMFFFVTAAVLVGIYASGIIFSALDDATGGGQTRISGQIFEAMARDANRMRLDMPSTGIANEMDRVWYDRLTNNPSPSTGLESYKNENYDLVIAEVEGDTSSLSTGELNAAMNEGMGAGWTVVGDDGETTIPVSQYFGLTPASSDDNYGWDDLIDGTVSGDYIEWSPSGAGSKGGGSIYYQNDMLAAVNLLVTPTIDFSYSPIEIYKTKWRLYGGEVIKSPLPIPYITIEHGRQDFTYEVESNLLQPVGEDNFFSIDMMGTASLSGGTAGASFSVDAFATELPFEVIFGTVISNMILMEILQMTLSSIPTLPLLQIVGPVSIDLRHLAMLILPVIYDSLLETDLAKNMVTGISGGNVDHESKMKEYVQFEKTLQVPVNLTRYVVGDAFTNFYEALLDSANGFMESLEYDTERAFAASENALRDINDQTSAIKQQQSWISYKGQVETYNDSIQSSLTNFINNTYIYKTTTSWPREISGIQYNEDTIATAIKQSYTNLVTLYNEAKNNSYGFINQRPDPDTINASAFLSEIYIPAFTTTHTNEAAALLTIDQIMDEFSSSNPRFKINVVVQDSATSLANGSQITDWDAYGSLFGLNNQQQVAAYYTTSESETAYLSSQQVRSSLVSWGISSEGVFPYKDWRLSQNQYTDDSTTIASLNTTAELSGRSSNTATADSKSDNTNSFIMLNPQAVEEVMSDVENLGAGDLLEPRTDILTLRPVGATSDEEDVKVSEGWIEGKPFLQFPVGAKLVPAYAQSAETIDYLMSQPLSDDPESTRRHLILADSTLTVNGEYTEEACIEKIAIMSYQDLAAVNALYDYGSMNFIIGFVGISVAMGVYMNFMFGLIQRIVNMAVLYIMSPVTISFYPFDDGQRFQSAFISPFYKHLISAYSIIISLNLFMSLMIPVRDATTAAITGESGESFGSYIIGTLVLIAFVSMLPKIRDSITSILGAESISEKKLGDVLKDAGKSIGADKWKKIGQGAVQVGDRFVRGSSVRRAKWESMKKKFDDSRGGSWINNKMNALKNQLPSKERIERARLMALGDSASDQEKDRLRELNGKGVGDLRKRDKLRMALGQKIAAERFSYMSDAEKKELGIDGMNENQAMNKIAMDNANRQKEGLFSGAKRMVASAKENLVEGSKYVGLDAVANTLFNPVTGMIAETGIGKMIRGATWAEQKKRMDAVDKKEEEWRKAQLDVEGVKEKQFTMANEKLLQAKNIKKDYVIKLAAMEQAKDTLSSKKAFEEFSKNFHMAAGDTEEEAIIKANLDWKDNNKKQRSQLFEERGGVDARVDQLINGTNGATIDAKYLDDAAVKFQDILKNKDPEALKTYQKDSDSSAKNVINEQISNFISKSGLKLDSDNEKEVRTIINESLEKGKNAAEISKQIAEKIPTASKKASEMEAHLGADFISKINEAKFNQNFTKQLISGASSFIKAEDKAREYAHDDLNVDVNSKAFKLQHQAYLELNDPSLENGFLRKEENLRRQFAGRLDSKEYHSELQKLQKHYNDNYQKTRDNAVSNWDARRFDYSIREEEREQAEFVNIVGKQFQNRIDYHLSNMSNDTKRCMDTDVSLFKLKKDGDYTGAALVMNAGVEAAIKKDWDALAATGLDKQTQEKFKIWGEQGERGHKELKSISGYYDLIRKSFGDVKGATDGRHLTAVRNQMAGMFQAIETKRVTEFLENQIKSLGSAEESRRRTITDGLKTIESNYSADVWDEVVKVAGFKDANDQPVKNAGKYFADVLTRISTGKISENSKEYKEVMNKMNKISNEWHTTPSLNKFMPANVANTKIGSFTSLLGKAAQANQDSDEQDRYNTMLQSYLEQFTLTMKKIAPKDK